MFRVGDDRLQSFDCLLEVFNVPFVVIGATEEESLARRQKIVGNVLVDARSIGIRPADEDQFTTPDEICEIVNRYLDRLAFIDTICTDVNEELVNRVGLAPVHVFIQRGLSGGCLDDVSAHDAQARNDLVETVLIERVGHIALRDVTVGEVRRHHVERGAPGADAVGEINDGNIGLFV